MQRLFLACLAATANAFVVVPSGRAHPVPSARMSLEKWEELIPGTEATQPDDTVPMVPKTLRQSQRLTRSDMDIDDVIDLTAEE